MEGPYEILVCADCKEEFVFTAEAEEYFRSRGFPLKPKRCKACWSTWKKNEEKI